MSDELSRFLSTGQSALLSSEKLETLGKEAAHLFLSEGVPLHDGILKVSSAVPEINAEQVRRVVEFANTAAYLALHDKAKEAKVGYSYPQFELADADVILRELGASPRSEEEMSIDPHYLESPPKQKLSSPKLDAELEKLFLGENGGRVKTAGLDFSYQTGVHQIMTMKEDLTALRDSLTDSAEKLDMLFKEAEADYYDAMKRHLLDGGSFADVARGANEVGEPATVRETLLPFVARLLQEKVAHPDVLHDQLQDLEKVACREIDTTHPFVSQFGAVLALRDEADKVAMAIEDVNVQLSKMKGAIKQEFLSAH